MTLQLRWAGHKKYNVARKRTNNVPNEEVIKASKEYKKAIKKAKAKYLAKKRTELKKAAKKPKEYWKLLDFKKNRDTIKVPISELATHFRDLNVTHENDELPENDPVDTVVIDDFNVLDDPFTEEEVLKTIGNLKNGKSPGEDLILNEFIKTHWFLMVFLTSSRKQISSIISSQYNSISRF